MIRSLIAGLFITALVMGGWAYWRQSTALEQVIAVDSPQVLHVQQGDTPLGVFYRLQRDGWLKDTFWLRLHGRLNAPVAVLPQGEYAITPNMTIGELLAHWRNGEVIEYRVTLVEGWNIRQVRAALAKQEALTQTLDDVSNEQLMDTLGFPAGHPEGQFFADTYRYTRGMTDRELLQRAAEQLKKVLNEEWEKREAGLPYQTPYQALTMASIIERETGVASERAEIAGVFIRRLGLGMLLQTDPTVIYGMGEAYQGRITRKDLRTPTPYNTYTQAGLPPTPIAIVGREAIYAALHPAKGRALYFVARGDGTHEFSETLDAHNRAVRRFQLQRRSDYRSSPVPQIKESP